MTFADIAQAWRQLPRSSTGRVLLNSETKRKLFTCLMSPEQREWFTACRAWSDGGPSPEDYAEICELLDYLDEYARSIARMHIACARAARLARALGLGDSNIPSMARTPKSAQTLLETLCKAIEPSAAPPSFTDLATQLLEVHWPSGEATAPALADRAFRLLALHLGVSLAESSAVSRDLMAELLEAPRQAAREQRLSGLLVYRGEGQEDDRGLMADLILEWIPDGKGLLYAEPALAFVQRDDQFRNAETNARRYVQERLSLWAEGWDVRWSLSRKDGQPLPLGLVGNSLGLALTVGLASQAAGSTPLARHL